MSPSRRAQKRETDERCRLAIIEIPGDATGCFEIICDTHDFRTHTAAGYDAAEFAALRHAMNNRQTLDRKDIRQ